MVLNQRKSSDTRGNNDHHNNEKIVDVNQNPLGMTGSGVNAVERDLRAFQTFHEWDPNLPTEKRNSIQEALKNQDVAMEVAIEQQLEEDSPYPEVRAAVRNYDDYDAPANTIRAWTIGLVMGTIGSGVNMLLSLRDPNFAITAIVVQLITYPIGVGWSKVFPNRQFNTFGVKWNLNPGPFNMKEHTVIVVMANAAYGGGVAYSTDTILAMQVKYGQFFGWGFQLLMTISTQCIGYGIAGVCRKFLVWPSQMIWPANLVNTSMFYALHDHTPSDPSITGGWRISRYRYFLYLMIAAFTWYWVPGVLFGMLSYITFPIWIAPNNVIVNQLFGHRSGLSLLPLTLDWTTVVGYIASPLIPPWHAIANTMIGLVMFFWIAVAGIHYTGGWYGKYLPIGGSGSYSRYQTKYNISAVLDEKFMLDLKKYKAYSPLFISTSFAMAYGLSFASIASLVTHTYLFHGKEIWQRWKASREETEDDVHMRMMKRYKDVPSWWYAALFGIMFALGMISCVVWPTNLTWWAYILALVIAFIFAIPVGIIQSITNIQIGLNVITEFIIGYIQPGRPLAMMLFKTYGYITMAQGLYFVQDLKLGHYMKVPPRVLFWAQTIATIWCGIVQICVMNWALGNIKDVCSEEQENHFTCPNAAVFFNASVIWGLIGPAKMFSPGMVYSSLMWFFLVGVSLPVAIWLAAKKWPHSNIRFLNAPVIFGGSAMIPPASPINYLTWGMVGFVFQKWIRNRWRGWWSTYNYITSAALDSGLAIATIVIFFALTMNEKSLDWWGNNIDSTPIDAHPIMNVQTRIPEGSTFGPSSW